MRKTILTLAIIILSFGCTKDDMANIEKPVVPSVTYLSEKFVVLDPVGEKPLEVFKKEFISKLSTRSGLVDKILFLGSLTIDNYLQSAINGIARMHTIFNKERVAYLKLSPGQYDPISFDNVYYTHYNVTLKYKDSTSVNMTAFVKGEVPSYKYTPTGENLLRQGHPSKQISYTVSGSPKPYYNEWNYNNYMLNRWQLRMDNMPIKADHKEPTDRHSPQYQPAHKF